MDALHCLLEAARINDANLAFVSNQLDYPATCGPKGLCCWAGFQVADLFGQLAMVPTGVGGACCRWLSLDQSPSSLLVVAQLVVISVRRNWPSLV